MGRKTNIVRCSADDLAAMIARGEDRTDWDRVRRTTPTEIEAQAKADGDELPEGWQHTAIMGLPPKKAKVNLRIDSDVLDGFRQSGKGYQTRINNVLRDFVESRRG
jgi:uncharacterized protein (DUF4415 family)